ncbi:Tetrahydromethanopterin S-methyltransferase, subunit F [Candidatus Methanophagaceae archaeon]|nr:Tetrahydromethanopterin S-methyltransferase, subunit F [Methanophagales archaeon]
MAAPKVVQQTPETAVLTARIEDLRHFITMIGRDSRFAAGLWAGLIKGLAIGLFTSFFLVGLKLVL